MKKYTIILLLLAAFVVPITGCSSHHMDNWRQNASQIKSSAFLFSKLATSIALKESNISAEDVVDIKMHVTMIRDLLEVPGEPNFSGARELVIAKSNPKYTVYCLALIDLLERYVRSHDLSPTEDQALMMGIISSVFDGALAAIDELSA